MDIKEIDKAETRLSEALSLFQIPPGLGADVKTLCGLARFVVGGEGVDDETDDDKKS